MTPRIPRIRYRELALLAATTATVLALGVFIARDVRQSADDANRLYDQLSQGLGLIDDILFETQEVRRILLYALHTSNANQQLQYAEQSRAAEARVARLLATQAPLLSTARTRDRIDAVRRAWAQYLLVRDDVIGLILEGSLPEGVALDEHEGAARFDAVRQRIAELKANFESEAEVQVAEARVRSGRATQRLMLLIFAAMIAAAVGLYVINRRAALEVLLRSDALKGSILQAVPDPIVSTDAGGRILELNESAEQTFGVRRAQVVGRRIEDAILGGDPDRAFASLIARTRHESSGHTARVNAVASRADGSQFPIELAGAMHIAGRDPVWTVHISDLTDRQLAEEHLRRAKESAETAARLKSDFLATVSHELRTPLTGVIGITELLSGADALPQHRDLLRMLRSSANALFELVSNVLDYSRIEAGLMDLAPVRFNVRTVIEEALDPFADAAARKGVDIGYTIDPGVPELVADHARVRQVLLNLLSNAVKFTDSGEVAVHASAIREPYGHVRVAIRVEDTGPGIPKHLQNRLFRRFSQIDRGAGSRGGTGLGLAICERLSRLLGGSIDVDSDENAGARFTFRFVATAASQPSEDPLPGSLHGVRVGVCLATGITGDQIRSLLGRWGALVTTDPMTADVVVADITAAESDAWLARAGMANAPMIVVSPLRHDRELPGRAAHVIVKPVRARMLYEALCTATGRWLPAAPEAGEVAATSIERVGRIAVLLVEDDDANRRVVQLMLNELGVAADEARSGIEAIECARSREYDVILMDVQLPGCSGLDATRAIRREQRSGGAPLIYALTANVMEEDEAVCRAAGMNGYITKPLRIATLESVLTRALPQRL